MSTKPITLWGHASGPNPWKVAIILEELSVPYELKFLDFSELKKEPYESLNPNGRVPTIEDPNTGLTIFESGAIIDYLLETYDKEQRLTPTSGPEQRWAARSWRDFQMSGQGPYFGQVVWFTRFHAQKHPDVIERYRNEVKRVVGVINRHLKKTGQPYLTGEKVVHSDLMWATWNAYLPNLVPEGTDIAGEFPEFNAWWKRIEGRESVKKIQKDKEEAMKADGH